MSAEQHVFNFDRLPKAARNYIRKLERDVQHYSDLAFAGPDNSNTFANPPVVASSDPNGRPLGQSPRIVFGDPRNPRTQIVACIEGGTLKVRSAHGGRLAVLPEVSNVVTIQVVSDL